MKGSLKAPEHHIFVCNSFRLSGEAQGACNKKGTPNLLQYLEEGISDRSLDAIVSTTGCLKVCDKGPVMIIQPEGAWYGLVNEDLIDSVLDGIESGELPDEGRIST